MRHIALILLLWTSSVTAGWDFGGGVELGIQEVERPVVRIYTANWCRACKEMKVDLGTQFENDIEILWINEPPEWVTVLPTIHWEEQKDIWKKIEGRLMVEDFETRVLGTIARLQEHTKPMLELLATPIQQQQFCPI